MISNTGRMRTQVFERGEQKSRGMRGVQRAVRHLRRVSLTGGDMLSYFIVFLVVVSLGLLTIKLRMDTLDYRSQAYKARATMHQVEAASLETAAYASSNESEAFVVAKALSAGLVLPSKEHSLVALVSADDLSRYGSGRGYVPVGADESGVNFHRMLRQFTDFTQTAIAAQLPAMSVVDASDAKDF